MGLAFPPHVTLQFYFMQKNLFGDLALPAIATTSIGSTVSLQAPPRGRIKMVKFLESTQSIFTVCLIMYIINMLALT